MTHDLSLHSGERQTAPTYDAIRADHRYRYEWVDARIPVGGFGLDAFCGNGYGTWLLAKQRSVWGIDASADAIGEAEKHYKTANTLFSSAYYPFPLPREAFDFIVSMESIEHVQDGARFFKSLIDALKPGGFLAFSTPCEDYLPLAATGNHFHWRHYFLSETLEMANTQGLKIIEWAGQDAYTILPNGKQGPLVPHQDMEIKKRTVGQFTICLSQKI